MSADDDRRRRATIRRQRAVLHKATLGEVEADRDPVEGVDAITLLTRLSGESWSLTGWSDPVYERGETPCRFVPGAKG